jgi:hypothetical protein
MKKWVTSLAFLLLWHIMPAQQIAFFAEDLRFSLSDSLFEVDGLYYFRNLTGSKISRPLFYPLPAEEAYGQIAYLMIVSANDTTNSLLRQTDEGAMFRVEMNAFQEKAYHIRYGQKMKNSKAKYIVTTTQHWKQPFEWAQYRLSHPTSITLDSVSIAPDSVAKADGVIHCFWERDNFIPATDFYFEFQNVR